MASSPSTGWRESVVALAAVVLPCALALCLVPRASFAQASDFTLVALPDTQYYTCDTGGSCENGLGIFASQTAWVAANRDAVDIRFVTHLGDCTQNGNVTSEFDIADGAYQTLELATGAGYADGIPYGISVGNHDQFPFGDPGSIPSVGDVNHPDQGTTTGTYNATFGVDRFCPLSVCRSYYGDHFGINNDNHYQLFSANGYDFIILHIEYMPSDTALRQAVISWANSTLSTHGDRRAIVASHYVLTNSANFSNQGSALYEGLKGNPNLFLILGGHVPGGESRRTDIFNGNTVHTVMSDYQNRSNGGNGWLRIMEFQPANNLISVRTYSPFLDAYETDSDSEFTLAYDMAGGYPGASTVTTAFQQGSDGYTGAVDTYIRVSTGAHGGEDHLFWDGSPTKYALLRFDEIFGTEGGEIPPGATILSADLRYVVDDNGNPGNVHEILIDWSESVDYAGFGNTAGAQAGTDYEASALPSQAPGTLVGGSPTFYSIDVKSSFLSWIQNPATNRGWIFVPTGNSGVGIRSAEHATSDHRPRLSVTYLPPECSVDLDCGDGDACTGAETCDAGACVAGSPLVCDDGNACTADACDEVTGCSNTPIPDCAVVPVTPWWGGLLIAVTILLSTIFLLRPNASDNAGSAPSARTRA